MSPRRQDLAMERVDRRAFQAKGIASAKFLELNKGAGVADVD